MNTLGKLFIGLFAALIITAIYFNVKAYNHIETHTVKVEGKERITEQSGNKVTSFYVVYTDKGTFKLEDDML